MANPRGDPKMVRTVTTEANHARGLDLALIYADGRGMLHDRITALRRANIFERHRYRHLIALPSFVKQDGNVLTAETPFAIFRIHISVVRSTIIR